MKFILNKDKLTIEDKNKPNSGSIKYYHIPVEHDEEWENLMIEAVIIKENAKKGIGRAVVNNKVYIDRALSAKYLIGFKGYSVEYCITEDEAINTNKTYYTRSGEEGAYIYTKVDTPVLANIETYYEATKDYQISTPLNKLPYKKGAGEVILENDEDLPSLSEWEVYVSQIQDMLENIETVPAGGTTGQVLAKKSNTDGDVEWQDVQPAGDYVEDSNYVHTDNNFSNTYKTNVDNNTSARHTHSNKSVLDEITSTDVSNWNNKSDFSGSYNDLSNKPNIPDELKDLSEDSTHRTVTDTEKNTWNNKSDFSGSYNDLTNKPTIPDVSGFVTKSVNDLTNYYLKSETYTQTEINNLINAISTMTLEVVQSLPTTNISTTTIYLVPKITSETNDSYDEYVYVSNNWEHIGSTDIDLSGYQTKIDSSHKLSSDLIDDTNKTNKFVTSAEKTAWGAKYDKPSGGISKADLADAVQTSLGKADTAVQPETGKGLFSGDYNDLNNKPTIPTVPTALSSFTDDLGSSPTHTHSQYLTSHQDISGKVDKVTGKGLSSNDFTNTYKDNVDSNTSARHTHTNKSVLDNFSGSYNDLSNKPSIPNNSNLVNGSATGSLRSVGSHSEDVSYTMGANSFSEGVSTCSTGVASHAEGYSSEAMGYGSHAEGYGTIARGVYSHAEGECPEAEGESSHAEGYATYAKGDYSHAEGNCSEAIGDNSHTEGEFTIASGENSHVQGKYNIEDNQDKYAHIVGNGQDDLNRSNAHTIDWNGVGWFAGGVKVGGTGQDDSNAQTLYLKPSGGIPKTDLSSAVQTSLGKADSALQSHQDISGKENISNKKTSITASSTDTDYPSAKAVYTAISQENMPSYVVQEAESVITKALSHNITGRTIRFIAASDAHNDATGMATVTADADSQLNPELTRNIQQSNQHCGMAMKYISDRLGVDFIAYLGDATWAGVQGRPYSQSILKADLEQMSGFLNFGARGVNQIRCVGNHDEMYTQSDSKRLQNVGTYDFYGRFCVGNKINPAGYGYYDIDSSNVRVLYLNTSDTVSDTNAGTKVQMTQEQINWLCDTLIDIGDKTGWKCIVLSHVPLDMFTFNNTYISDILKAYTNGETYGNYNFSGHNSTPILANVHGHVHCYRVDYMSNKIRRFAIPNCCYTDNNHYLGRSGYETWCEDTTYNKTPNSAQDTSFSLVTIDLDNNYCYVDNYGAGYDRNFSLDYKSGKYPTAISNINYSGTTTVGANIDANAFTYTITYSDTSTESKSLPVTVSPTTIQQVGNNTVRVTYTEDIYSVYNDITIVGTAAPVVNLLNMNRTYDVLATGTNISNALSESVAYTNILYSTSNGYYKSCTVNSHTANSLSMKESGDSSICVAYAIHLPNTSKDIRVTFDYSGPNACRVYRSYADSTNLRTWAGASVYQDNTAEASGSADVTIEKASTAAGAGYDWLILMFSSNGGGTKQYSNVVVEQVD